MNLIDNVKDRANAQIDTQKSRATDTLGVIANAVRGTTEQLRTDHHEVLAQYIEGAANQLDRVSATLRDKDVGTLIADARRLARRQPALFIGGSFALGLLAARFMKSSDRSTQSSRYRGTNSRDYSRSADTASPGVNGPGAPATGVVSSGAATTPATGRGQR